MFDRQLMESLPSHRFVWTRRSLALASMLVALPILEMDKRLVRRTIKDAGYPAVESRPARGHVLATVETDPVPSKGDAADDPCIWVHPTDPSQSTIIGTDKKGGLVVYSLAGRLIQYVDDGLMVNVDVRDAFPLGGHFVSIATAGNRANHTLAVYAIDETTRTLKNVASRPIFLGMAVYGSCMYRSARSGGFFVFIDSKNGRVEQWQLFDNGMGLVNAQLRRAFDVGTDVEGCVADDELGYLYIGEEDVGIWKYPAEPDAASERSLVDHIGSNGHLTPDVEGLALYYGANGTGYLLASSQGSDEFVVYRRERDNAFVMSFAVSGGNGIDAVTHADGIDVVSRNMGPAFPDGFLVTQDDRNDVGNQNFKLVPWGHIEELLQKHSYSAGSRSEPRGSATMCRR